MSETGKLTVGSLFAGIGGFDLGLDWTGRFETKWFCETDPYCRRVLAKHWPGVPCHGDIRELRGADPVDVLCGGFPCQDISLAGRGAGLSGARSGLWSEYARLVRELRPSYVIVENVPALRKRGLEVVLADLLACGYDAEWDGIPAAAVGARHRRDRIWIVAYPQRSQLRLESGRECRTGPVRPALPPVDGAARDLARGTGALAHPDCGGRNGRAGDEHEAQRGDELEDRGRSPRSSAMADAQGVGPGGSDSQAHTFPGSGHARQVSLGGSQRGRSRERAHSWATEPDVGRVADGVPARVDRLRGLGNALVPQIAEWIGYRIAEHEGLI